MTASLSPGDIAHEFSKDFPRPSAEVQSCRNKEGKGKPNAREQCQLYLLQSHKTDCMTCECEKGRGSIYTFQLLELKARPSSRRCFLEAKNQGKTRKKIRQKIQSARPNEQPASHKKRADAPHIKT